MGGKSRLSGRFVRRREIDRRQMQMRIRSLWMEKSLNQRGILKSAGKIKGLSRMVNYGFKINRVFREKWQCFT